MKKKTNTQDAVEAVRTKRQRLRVGLQVAPHAPGGLGLVARDLHHLQRDVAPHDPVTARHQVSCKTAGPAGQVEHGLDVRRQGERRQDRPPLPGVAPLPSAGSEAVKIVVERDGLVAVEALLERVVARPGPAG